MAKERDENLVTQCSLPREITCTHGCEVVRKFLRSPWFPPGARRKHLLGEPSLRCLHLVISLERGVFAFAGMEIPHLVIEVVQGEGET